ncbi:MAG: hypothetical protein QNK92_15160 [Amylibacter sp.]
MRRLLGYLGFALPLVLILGALLTRAELEPSISDFYHTALRDLFVGVLITMGVFLMSYQGYERKEGEPISDNILATFAGLMAFGVALFPNETTNQTEVTFAQSMMGLKYTSLAHYVCAILFCCASAHSVSCVLPNRQPVTAQNLHPLQLDHRRRSRFHNRGIGD